MAAYARVRSINRAACHHKSNPVCGSSLGTSEQHRFVAELMLSTISRGSTPAPSPVDVGGLTVHSIFAKVLRNAEFWELPNLRSKRSPTRLCHSDL